MPTLSPRDTRATAVAEEVRDALCQMESYQLLQNCMKNQIGMVLFDRPYITSY